MRAASCGSQAIYRSYADFYLKSAYGSFPQQHRSLTGSLRSSLILVDQARHELIDPAVDELVVSTPLRAACSYDWNMGSGWTTGQSRTGDLILVPPGTSSRWRTGGDRRLIILAIPVPLVRLVLRDDCPIDLGVSFTPLAGASGRDAFVADMLHRLWDISGEMSLTRAAVIDGMVQDLVCHLLDRAGAAAQPRQAGAFSALEWRTIEAYVDAHLHGDIPVLELADVAGRSVRHFSRIFRRSIGQTPHEWIVARRVGRAKDLLAADGLSLAEIALSCGFADQSHFTTSFRRLTGLTPLRWRRGHERADQIAASDAPMAGFHNTRPEDAKHSHASAGSTDIAAQIAGSWISHKEPI